MMRDSRLCGRTQMTSPNVKEVYYEASHALCGYALPRFMAEHLCYVDTGCISMLYLLPEFEPEELRLHMPLLLGYSSACTIALLSSACTIAHAVNFIALYTFCRSLESANQVA